MDIEDEDAQECPECGNMTGEPEAADDDGWTMDDIEAMTYETEDPEDPV